MIERFVFSQMKEATYVLKEDTKTSYYWKDGVKLLPNRICFSKDTEMSKVASKGRNTKDPFAGQLISAFTKNEESPLKQVKPYRLRTQIWKLEEYPQFVGYGSIGITQVKESGDLGVVDVGDLIVLYTPDECKTLKVFVFSGMAKPDDMQKAFSYLCNAKGL